MLAKCNHSQHLICGYPSKRRRRHKLVFDTVHNLAHPGIKSSQNLISARFVWPCMKIDVKHFAKTCIACQKNKITRHNSAPFNKFTTPTERFAHVHIDIVGPLPESKGYSYLFTMIDRFTRHFEAIPLRDISARTCADNFVLHWVSRFGSPLTITTDRGAQFTGTLWRELAAFFGARLQHTTSYHPQANGMVERLHRTLNAAMRAQHDPTAWFSNLGIILLGLRAAVKEDLGVSSSELTIGKALRIPGEFFVSSDSAEPPSLSDSRIHVLHYLNSLTAVPPRDTHNKKAYVDKALQTCSHVFVRSDHRRPPLASSYEGPFLVLDKCDKYFTLDLCGRADTVSVDRLKAAHLLLPNLHEPSLLATSFENYPSDHFSPPISPPRSPPRPTLTPRYINRFGRAINKPSRFR